jgi:enterochelin esterase family protein
VKRDLLIKARAQGTPLIEGDTATFVWHGKVAPKLIGDFTDWEDGAPVNLTRLSPKIWIHQLQLPADAYIEYAFIEGEERLVDPFNPRRVSNGMGKRNHWFGMPGYAATPLAWRRREAPRGQVTRHLIETGGLLARRTRSLYLYQPPVDGPAPLLVVWDGRDYLQRGRLACMVDNLIAAGRIRPVALAMIENGRQARMLEYACSESTIGFLVANLLPFARAHLNLLDPADQPGAYGVLGASMGGLMALYTGLRLPHIFGRVLSQSGAFSFDAYDLVVYDLARCGPACGGEQRALNIWMDVGRYEWLLDTNRRMVELLRSKGYPVAYHEYHAGHNYPAWRDDVWRGLEHLFGV